MKTYKITLADGTEMTIEAAKFITDGAGTRLFDAAGDMVAAFADGQVKALYPVATLPA